MIRRMGKINYLKEQMHRIRYTRLSPIRITEKLSPAAATGPAHASPVVDTVVGRTPQTNTDGAPSLNCAGRRLYAGRFGRHPSDVVDEPLLQGRVLAEVAGRFGIAYVKLADAWLMSRFDYRSLGEIDGTSDAILE